MADESTAPVLIAYDGSDFAKAAIVEAGRQLRPGRRAIVVTVTEPMDQIPFIGAAGVPIDDDSMKAFYDAARTGGEKTAEEGCELARAAGLEPEPLVATGAPIWNRIVEAADEHGADLIVIGSRGLSGLKYAVLGSVAAAVSQHSRRTVLIAHRA
ncbi:MAG: universal stress protein [Solirubrobacterales bacterium]